jgi:catechol-2,3-dioxygenase
VASSPVTGFSHVQLLVADVTASERWYTTVLGLERLTAADDESYVALRHRPGRMVVVLTRADAPVGSATAGDRLDHLAFAVPDGPTLEAWATQLATLGIEHPGVVDELGKPSLTLTDPDGIRIELVAPPGT